MADIHASYSVRSSELQQIISRLTSQVRLGAGLRLLAFVLSVLGFFDLPEWGEFARWIIGLGFFAGFLGLVRWNRALDRKRSAAQARLELCEAEMASLQGDHSYWHPGAEFFEARHAYAADLDLFGQHSIYRMLSRAFLPPGRRKLAERLSAWCADHAAIRERQNAAKELAPELDWRLNITVESNLAGQQPPDFDALSSWGKEGNVHALRGMYTIIAYIIPAWTAAVITLQSLGLFSELQFAVCILAPLLFVGRHLSKTQAVNEQLGKQFKGLQSLSGLFDQLGNSSFKSTTLVQLQKNGKGAGAAFRSLARITNAFDNRNNVVVAVVMNILVGWDFWCLMRLEAWHKEHGDKIDDWIDTLAELETVNSLAAFAYNHPGAVWPSFHDQPAISSENLGHPLIGATTRVDNDFGLDERAFAIITGANMAGKSTFLRTLGVNLVLAMSGAPVIASSFSFKSIPLFTSMRTTDALEEQASYFYAELRRLQEVIELLESGEQRFVILDEILKGTNSKDKAEGSRKFLEKLSTLPATGVVATHDLSLCEITASYPQIRNLCFDVEIAEDDLLFDYKLRDGICSNMNATFLMDKMGITR